MRLPPLLILFVAASATGLFVAVCWSLPRFASEAQRFFLLYYHAPIGLAFVIYGFDRLAQWRPRAWGQWLWEAVVVASALSRVVAPLPFFSGHALFLTYALGTLGTRWARLLTGLVLLDVLWVKLVVLQGDWTLWGGVTLGLLALGVERWLERIPR